MTDAISLRNQKAHDNGEWGEHRAEEILKTQYANVHRVNDIMDFLVGKGQPIEFKTCQKLIETGVEKYSTRNGRFVLNKDQDEFLKLNNGIYIFIVKDDKYVMGWKMLPAKNVQFKRHIPWNKLIGPGILIGGI